jgi:hypothetical protein
MRRLYTAQVPLMIDHLKNILESGGIECVVRNSYLAAAMGEIPPIECWPELWVVEDEQFEEAQAVLKGALSPVVGLEKPWQCKGCGEMIEGQFTECWNCGSRQWLGRR